MDRDPQRRDHRESDPAEVAASRRLPAEAVRGSENSMPMYALAKTLSGAPRPCHQRRDGHDFVVFCFAMSEDAQAFAERFGGERLTRDH
jgi:hypothetical protein